MAFLLVQEVTYHRALSLAESPTTLMFSFACKDDETLWEAYEMLSSSDNLPDIRVLTLANEDYAGVYWDFEYNKETYYTPYGRFFTEKEISDGENVVLLSTNMIYWLIAEQNDKSSIWENPVNIEGVNMTPVGSYNSMGLAGSKVDEGMLVNSAFAAYITMPLGTYLRLGLKPKALYCEFASPLTKSQVNLLKEFASSLKGAERLNLPISGSEAVIRSYTNQGANILTIMLGLLIMIQVLIHWMRSEFERFRIWLICGAKRKHILFQMFLEVFLLVTLSFLFTCGINAIVLRLMPGTVITALPLLLTAVIYAFFLLFVFAAIYIQSASMIYRNKLLEK